MSQFSRHPRRKLLQLGLAGMALPPLASLLGASKVARAATTTQRPARLVTIFFPNGVSLPPEGHQSFDDWHWFPHHPGPDYVMTKTLQPLAALRSELSILSGFSHPHLRSNITHSCSAQFLTGDDQSKGYKNSISYDQVFAEKIDGATRYSSLALSASGGTGSLGRPATISVNRDGALIPALSDPQQIFNRLFVVDARGAEARARAIARDRSILDRVSSRLSGLNGALSADDRHRLDAYFTATRTLERQLERANEWLNVPKPEVDPGAFDLDAEPTRELGTNYVRTMFDLIHMALLTDSTRVVTYQTAIEGGSGRGNQLPYAAGLSLHHHQLSHSAARDEGGWERWAKFDQYLTERLSEFLTKMAETPDPLAEGSLLDNTIVLYGSGTSKTHVGRNYPLILAGGKNLGVKQGAFHRFEDERPFNDLLLTLLQRVGVETESFGDSESVVDQILV
ncbi:DUF1552 domain-containing protein [Stieleria sp.]|uniref:DUF1552 domain-containing protein n=1 Tax=Stieleria sp. TaxID=2795976 RepID=UPI00356AAC54